MVVFVFAITRVPLRVRDANWVPTVQHFDNATCIWLAMRLGNVLR